MERGAWVLSFLSLLALSGCATGQTFLCDSRDSNCGELVAECCGENAACVTSLIDSNSCGESHCCAADDGCGEGCVTSRGASGLDGGFEHGGSFFLLDGVGWVVGIPSKLLLWNTKVDSHNVSEGTQEQLKRYLAARGLNDVKVRVNQYDPVGEWKRLVGNEAIHPGWKYTVGALAVTRYSLLPGRVFGGDDYNPFTNSISLYSDRASIALREGARAKRTNESEYRGLYSATNYLPGSPLWVDPNAVREVMAYAQETNQRTLQRESYLVLLPASGARLGQSFTLFVDPGATQVASASFALVGHAVGRTMAFRTSDTPMQMVKSVYGIVKRPQDQDADGSDTAELQESLPPGTPRPVKFVPVDVIYQPTWDSI